MIIKHLKPMFIVDELWSLGFLHQFVVEDIKAEGARWRKCQKLCESIRCGSELSFHTFMETLKNSGQGHIAAAILDERDIEGMQWSTQSFTSLYELVPCGTASSILMPRG